MGRDHRVSAGRSHTAEMRRPSTLVAVVVALVGAASCDEVPQWSVARDPSDFADGFMAEVEELLQLKPKTAQVSVAKSPAEPPEPTIKSLMPKHAAKQTAEFQKKNGGQAPDAKAKLEINRKAVQAAAKEINDAQAAEKAAWRAGKAIRKLRKKIGYDRKNIKTVERNEAYAAKKAFEAADRKVKRLAYKSKLRTKAAAAQLKKMKKAAAKVHVALQQSHKVDQAIIDARKRYLAANDVLKIADQNQYKENTVLAKAKAVGKNSRMDVQRANQFLDNVESHKAKARLTYRSSKILAEYEEQDAEKVTIILRRLTAKRDAVFKFTKSLEAKAQRDLKAATTSIEKAKDDYATAVASKRLHAGLLIKFTKKYKKSVKYAEDSRMGVIDGIDDNYPISAIVAGENYNRLKKAELRDKEAMDKEVLAVKEQKELIKVAEADLARAQTVKTKAEKQMQLVAQKKITMRAQLEKIDFLKAEVKKHKEKGERAAVAARDALYAVKNMEKMAIQRRHEAVARERYALHVDTPLAKRALKKANVAVKRDKAAEDDERKDILALDRDKRSEIEKVKYVERQQRKWDQQLKTKLKKARFAKRKLVKAESQRDAVLTRNAAKMAKIKKRLADAEENFKKADKKAPAAQEVQELGEHQ